MRRLSFFTLLLVLACSGSEPPTGVRDSAPATLRILPLADILVPGQKQARTAELKNQAGQPVSAGPLSWRSSAPEIATVSNLGEIVAKSVGQTTISVAAGALEHSVIITVVEDRPTTIALTSPARLLDGAGQTIHPAVLGLTGQTISAPLAYASSNPQVASIDQSGLVVANSPGTTTLTVSAGALSASKDLVVDPTPLPIRLVFTSAMPSEVKDSIYAAATRWAQVFDKPLASVGQFQAGPIPCTDALPNFTFNPNNGILVIVRAQSVDGPGGAFANAAVCLSRPDGLTAIARITFDLDDAAAWGPVSIRNASRHEIGHGLGIGAVTTIRFRSGVPGPDPVFTGPEAVRQYSLIFNKSATGVPLENALAGGLYTHWRLPEFSGEVMSSSGFAGLISRVSLGALIDFGYGVDLNKADLYPRP